MRAQREQQAALPTRAHRFLKRVVVAEEAELAGKRPQHHERDALASAGDAEHDLRRVTGEGGGYGVAVEHCGLRAKFGAHRGAQREKRRYPHADGGVVLLLLRLGV